MIDLRLPQSNEFAGYTGVTMSSKYLRAIEASVEAFLKTNPAHKEKLNELVIMEQLHELHLNALQSAQSAVYSAEQALRSARAAHAETKVRIELLKESTGYVRCCEIEDNVIELEEEDIICRDCKEHASPVECKECGEQFGSNCCGA